jgi:hypothetical protein
MARLDGGCACGRTRYGVTAPPLFVHCCHCLRCQRETGSAFVLNALIETDRLDFFGASPVAIGVPTDSGKSHRIFRCEACETALCSEYGGVEKLRFVRVGTLDAPHALSPDVHIHTRSKVPWVALPAGVPAFETYYDSKLLWPAESLKRRAAIFS